MQFTLLTDGSSDRTLIPILEWLLRDLGITTDLAGQWAELRHLRQPPVGLTNKVRKAIELYPCDLLFIHRDAEAQVPELRSNEINQAVQQLWLTGVGRVPHVCVVPVRMQEAWLLINETAIRHVSGNPNGQAELDIPNTADLEDLTDPKQTLYDLIKAASGLSHRRLRKLSLSQARLQLAGWIEDYSALRQLPAFGRLEEELRVILEQELQALGN